MNNVSLDLDNVMPDGGNLVNTTFSTTATIVSKVATNRSHYTKASFYCSSPDQAGTFDIYDVDSNGEANLITSQAVVADTLEIYTHNHVMYAAYCTFVPTATAGDGTDRIRMRVLFGRP